LVQGRDVWGLAQLSGNFGTSASTSEGETEMNDYYNQGWDAFEQGLDYNDCPFERGTMQEYDWQQGYRHSEEFHSQ
jgi:hypothetical protein